MVRHQVSQVLKIHGRAFIIGYGSRYTHLRCPGVIDFRSTVDGKVDSSYRERPFVITVDPIVINYDDDFTDQVMLDTVDATLSVGDYIINFKWLYLVELTASSEGWLGYDSSVFPTKIEKDKPYTKSIMLKQHDDDTVSWEEIIDCFNSTDVEFLTIKITLKFEYFEKVTEVSIPTQKLIKDCLRAQAKYNLAEPYPYFMQQSISSAERAK